MVNNTMIGALRVEATLESGKFVTGAKQIKAAANDAEKGARQSFSKIEKSAAGAGKGFSLLGTALKGFATGLSISLFVDLAAKGLEYAKSLGEVAAQAGTTTRDLQVLRYAAGQLGVSQADLDKGLNKLTVTLGRVAAGAVAPTKALAAIGITAKQLQGLDTGTAFRMISDGLSKVEDRAERAAIEVALFGESGSKLDSMLAGGSGAINELARAADELGIVLSQEEIAKADETANKLEAVKRVLATKIASVVVANADAIVALADSLAYLITQAGQAAAKMTAFYRTIAIQSARWSSAHPELSKIAFGKKGTAAILSAGAGAIRANIADKRAPRIETAPPRADSSIPDFLAPSGRGGGGRKRSGRAPRDTSLRDAFEFENEQRRADMDILRAKQDLAHDYVERTAISIQLLDLEKQGYEAELAYKVKAGELSQAQADELKAKFLKVDALKRQAVLEDEEVQRKEDYNKLEMVDFDLQREHLEKQRNLAETAAERRDIELRLLDLAYRQEKARLEAVLADEKSSYAAQEEARRRLLALSQNYQADRKAVVNSTAGPMEAYLNSLPTTAAKWEEALQQVKVNGLDALTQGILDTITGVESLGQAFKKVAQQIIADLLRIYIQKTLIAALGNILAPGAGSALSGVAGAGAGLGMAGGSLPGMANGGSFQILGNKGVDRNIMSINGIPVARVMHGERVSVDPNGGGGDGMMFAPTIHINGPVTDPRKTGMQIASAMRSEISRSSKRGY